MNTPSTSQRQPELIVALDLPFADVPPLLGSLPQVRWFKVGLEMYTEQGPRAVSWLREHGRQVFLDLKLHDIPRTVARAVQAAARHGVSLLTLHAAGGRAMLRAAAEAAGEAGSASPRLVAVTTLTSLGPEDLRDIGVSRSMPEQALALAELALSTGLHGVVTSAQEAADLRKRFGPDPILVTPGIRPAGTESGDQKRVATAAMAVHAGASMLVVGRPILEAAFPGQAAQMLLDEIHTAATCRGAQGH